MPNYFPGGKKKKVALLLCCWKAGLLYGAECTQVLVLIIWEIKDVVGHTCSECDSNCTSMVVVFTFVSLIPSQTYKLGFLREFHLLLTNFKGGRTLHAIFLAIAVSTT